MKMEIKPESVSLRFQSILSKAKLNIGLFDVQIIILSSINAFNFWKTSWRIDQDLL
jgi:hypothetical protein